MLHATIAHQASMWGPALQRNKYRSLNAWSQLRIPVDQPVGMYVSTTKPRALNSLQYQYPRLDNVEDVELYRKGGFHPIELGASFKQGRYGVLHKLGFGGFSTVWLARDRHRNTLIALKVLTAEASQSNRELRNLHYLDMHAGEHRERASIISNLDEFAEDGPNGRHTCLVSHIAGPSLAQIFDSPGEVAGTRRLERSLVPRLARQLAEAVAFLHKLGIVHGGIAYPDISKFRHIE